MDATLGFRDEFHDELRQSGSTCDGADDCRRAVRRQIARGVDVIKIATTGGVNSRIGLGLGAQMFEDEARAMVETAHLYGKRVAVHAHGADGINLALRVGADLIEHGTLLDDESLRLFRQTRAYYVPTLSTVNGYIERLRNNPNAYSPDVREKIEWRIGITGQALRRAFPAGVRIAFGTDAGVSMHGRNADEFLLMVQHGMDPMSAIVAATVNAADLLGLAAEAGTIEPGKSADIVAVRGDPLADVGVLRNMSFVMARGRVHRLDPERGERFDEFHLRPKAVPARLGRGDRGAGARRLRRPAPRSDSAAARSLYDSIFEGMLRAAPEMATGLGLDTGERAFSRAASATLRRPARWARTSRCSTICRSSGRSTAANSRAASAPGSTPCCGWASACPKPRPSPMAASPATIIRSPMCCRS